MSVLRITWNITAALVGALCIPLGYLLIGKPIRGLLMTLLLIGIAIFTAGIGLIIAYPVAVLDIATGGKLA